MAANKKNPQENSGRFSYDGLERVMHEKARLGILTSLVGHAEVAEPLAVPLADVEAEIMAVEKSQGEMPQRPSLPKRRKVAQSAARSMAST